MPSRQLARSFGRTVLAALLLGLLPGPEGVEAGVPRSCVHPHYDPVACARDTRREHRDVLPSRRVRELDAQRLRLERVAPLEDVERNELLRDLRDAVRYRRAPR